MTPRERRRQVVVAGHRGEVDVIVAHLADDDAGVREAALGALARTGSLTDAHVRAAFGDPAPVVRRRAASLAATRPGIDLLPLLDDADVSVVEVAAWACGEQEQVAEATLDRLIALATGADDALVRESAAAALGAIGDPRGLPAILIAVDDKPNVRRRAVLALAPFDGPEVDAAIDKALNDRDWQVRQAAEDLRRATGELDV
jgi:HEAT repeat protein